MKMLILQHNDVEGPGLISDWAAKNNYEEVVLRSDQGVDLKAIRTDEFDFLTIMGGDQSVLDADGWIYDERALIQRAIKAGKPVAGICLGAQQIALSEGALIDNSEVPEIGVMLLRVSATNDVIDAEEMNVFHFHGQQFSLPNGAKRLFETDVDHNQGFMLNDQVLGLQFHLEMTEAELKELAEMEPDDPQAPNAEQVTMAQAAQQTLPSEDKDVLFKLLDHINR